MSRLPGTVTIGRREVTVGVTAIDQLVNWISPERGASRFAARLRQTALGGGYQSADRRRSANRNRTQPENDADGNILPDLATLREDSQHLLRNSPIAVGAVATNITRIVGTGLKVRPQIDRSILTNLSEKEADAWEIKARNEFLLATETREIDAERQLPFSLMQGLALRKVLEDGDLLVNLPRFARPGSPYTIKLQLIEAARVCNENFATDTATLVAGVEKDQHGAPASYHVLNRHPGNYGRLGQDDKWQKLSAFGAKSGAPQCLHLYDKLRPGQTRGVPYLAPVVELIKQLGKYTDAEVMAAVVTGMFTVFITNPNGTPGFDNSQDNGANGAPIDTNGMEMGAGSIIGLLPGEKPEFANPGRPNTAFDPFVIAILRQIGAALEIPFELLVKHFTASYSAAKAALEEAKVYFIRRRHWLATQFCQPVYEAVITEAVASGRLSAPGFFASHQVRRAYLSALWTGDAFAQLDPVKEIKAAELRIANHITTRTEERLALTGGDWEANLPQMVKERKLIVSGGLDTDTKAADPQAPPEPDGDDQP